MIGSLLKLKDLDPVVIGVPGIGEWLNPSLAFWGSELCLKRERFNRPPRLDLPVVEEELRPDPSCANVGRPSSSGKPRKEPLVGLLPFCLGPLGYAGPGEDLPDLEVLVECLGDAELLGGGNFGIEWSNKPGDEGEVGDGRKGLSCSFTPGR